MRSLVLPTIEDAFAYGYDALSDPDDLYHSPQWLKMDEAIGIARPFNVLCVPDGERPPVVAASWGLIVDDDAFWPFMRVDTVLSMLMAERQVPQTPSTEKMLRSLMPNAYLGALRGGTTRLRVDPRLSGEMALRAIGEVLAGAESMARAEGIRSIAFFYVPPEELLLRQVLRERGYAEVGPAVHVSVLRTSTFKNYLGRLSGNRRRSITRERNLIARSGVQIGLEVLTGELSEEMLPLEAQLYRKYGHEHPTKMARILHHAVIAEFGDAAPVITARYEGVLRGYAAFIQINNTLYARDVGFDYVWQQKLRKLPLYFEVVFYSAIELAERSGVRQIYYSYEAEETKLSRGCDLQPRVTYVKALDEEASAELHRLSACLSYAEPG